MDAQVKNNVRFTAQFLLALGVLTAGALFAAHHISKQVSANAINTQVASATVEMKSAMV